ncbi:hypothetical protein NDU88_008731 [Pleurodeles waltl]|uniref:Uncharacterized protein n=1 Tax=Pleurodeles waltl TaxID=8319 RepID=A0AAV7P4E5_PLEWA|nr:hypothetical protein NDU88_008731 [Pleurodeles waltl]
MPEGSRRIENGCSLTEEMTETCTNISSGGRLPVCSALRDHSPRRAWKAVARALGRLRTAASRRGEADPGEPW